MQVEGGREQYLNSGEPESCLCRVFNNELLITLAPWSTKQLGFNLSINTTAIRAQPTQ
jgi:hypothetical protein